MSLSYKPLVPVLVRSPLSEISNQRYYAVLKTGLNKTEKIWSSTSISNSSIQWSCPPPSAETFTSRTVLVKLPISVTITCNGGAGPANTNILRYPFVGPRFLPISGSLDTLRVSINGLAVSIDLADCIHAFTRYNTGSSLKNGNYSMSASFADTFMTYAPSMGGGAGPIIKSPLNFYGDSTEDSVPSRLGNFVRVYNNMNGNNNAQAGAYGTIQMIVTEPLFLSPLYFGEGEGSSFYNVNTFDINMNFLSTACRFISAYPASTPAANATYTSTFAIAPNNMNTDLTAIEGSAPQIYFTYITPGLDNKPPINMPISYSYSEVLRYVTSISTPPAYNIPATNTTNSIQLSSIPRRIYIYIRARNQNLYDPANGFRYTDTYCAIDQLNVTFGNRNGYFASASPQQLYQMSKKNGLCMSYIQFRGGPVFRNGNDTFNTVVTNNYLPDDTVGTIGSVICIQFGEDICDEDIVPGLLGQWNFQATVTYRTLYNQIGANGDPAAPQLDMYVLVVNEGVFTIPNIGSAVTQIGVLSHKDILEAQEDPFYNYENVMNVSGAGNFFSGLKKFGEKVYRIGKAAAPYVREAYDLYKRAAPDISKAVMGNGVHAGVVLGGRDISREELRRRMMRHR